MTVLESRWQKDVLSIRPDVLSILIGTNDIHYWLEHAESPFDLGQWEWRYRQLLNRTKEVNPSVRFVLGAPFTAKTGKVGEADNFTLRDSLIHRMTSTIARIAADYYNSAWQWNKEVSIQSKSQAYRTAMCRFTGGTVTR